MRYEPTNPEVSTLRRAEGHALPHATDWGFAPEPPTHLPPSEIDDLELATNFAREKAAPYKSDSRGAVQARSKAASSRSASRSRSDSIVTSAPRPSRVATNPRRVPQPEPLPEPQSVSRSARGSQPQPLPQPPVTATPAPAPVPAPGPTAAPAAEQVPAFMAFAGGAAFDPLSVPLPPELAPPIFSWVRRLALQADLASADRLLRDAIAELTSSLSVVIIYAGPDGFYTVGADDELPKDTQPVIAVGKARRALVGPHSGLIPIATSSETIAVIQLVRNVRQPAFAVQDHITMAAIARECAAVLHHLVVVHLTQRNEQAADKKSLYRPEALEHHRKKGSEGVVTDLSPKWIKRAYPFLIASMVIALVFGIVLRVPTYSSGFGLVRYASTPVTSSVQGVVEKIYVEPGQSVHVGDAVAKLASVKEDADYLQTKSESENAVQAFLFDDQDEQARKTVRSATLAEKHAATVLDQRVIRATADGKVSDIFANVGKEVALGQELMAIVKPGTKPEVLAFMPANDRPRIKSTMALQVDVVGFSKQRSKLRTTFISSDAVGAAEIRREVGQQLADTLKLPNDGASYITVRGEFDSDRIQVGKKTFELHNGMAAKVEIQIESRPFLVSIFPLFEKYFD